MTLEILTALCLYAFVTSVTPGPNNVMLMASGANFGFARTVPHMLGVGIGFGVMVFLVGVGLMGVFQAIPHSDLALKLVSVVYMLYLAWKIASASGIDDGPRGSQPMTFLQAAAFQWVNPKAWSMALAAISLYAASQSIGSVAVVAAVFLAVNIPSVSLWALAGTQVRRLLSNPAHLRLFNITMAALLVLSLYPILQH
ncbi:MAG: LysE family translocator [Rhizobiaceae bacterium]